MLDCCQNERQRTILRVLWETGARVSELVELRHCDIQKRYLISPNGKQHQESYKVVYLKPALALDRSLLCLLPAHWDFRH